MKRPYQGTDWQPAEICIVENAAKRLLAGRYVKLSEATEDCLAKLRGWYATLPAAPESGREYPRTIAAIRNKLYQAAVLRGYRASRVLWTPPERLFAYKWAKKFIRHQKDHPPLARLDAGRGLLVELFVAGYDRSLDSCTMELDKCLRDIARGEPRRCGHGLRAVSLPASIIGRKAAKRRTAARHRVSASGALSLRPKPIASRARSSR
jgi:hypothetical protein